MYGPGRYVPDPTEGSTPVKALPAPHLVAYHRDQKQTACPRCSHLASRHTSGQRLWHDVGDVCTGHPSALLVTYASPSGDRCTKHCTIALSAGAPPGAQYDHRVLVPCATIQHWDGGGGEKKAHEPMGGAVLAWARAALSGSAAVDARSEGPDCVVSAGENRHDQRVVEE